MVYNKPDWVSPKKSWPHLLLSTYYQHQNCKNSDNLIKRYLIKYYSQVRVLPTKLVVKMAPFCLFIIFLGKYLSNLISVIRKSSKHQLQTQVFYLAQGKLNREGNKTLNTLTLGF